ncbi:MAG TPA: hypothetical protein VNE00_06650 [Paraburkholderia sp.]|nr:hypothetical protein [Paraburkholderia sp.]
MQLIPTHAELIAAIGRPFSFGSADGHTVEAHLIAAPAGIPMDDSYTCYFASFALPAGVSLPQDTYRITSPDGHAWDLLATPTRPQPDGRATLSFVVHSRLADPTDPAGTGAVS